MSTTNIGGVTAGTVDLSTEDSIKLRTLIAEMEAAMEQRLPGYKTMLDQIHSILRSDPAQVTLLAPEDAAAIVKGQSARCGEFFEEKVVKKTASKVSSAAKKGNLSQLL